MSDDKPADKPDPAPLPESDPGLDDSLEPVVTPSSAAGEAEFTTPPPPTSDLVIEPITTPIGTSPDLALIYSILQGGLLSYFKVRDKGVRAKHFSDKEGRVYSLFEMFVGKGRLPNAYEIKTVTGVDVEIPKEPYDLDVFSKRLIDRALYNALKDGLRPVIYNSLVKNPTEARDMLAQLVRDTAWSVGGISSYTDSSTALAVLAAYELAKARGGSLLGLSSPWQDVDKHSLGLQNGELTVILAKRKVGKSWILFKWFLHILKNDLKAGECLLLVSMEMPIELIWRRLAAIDLGLCYKDFRGGTMTMESEKRLADWVERMKVPDPSRPTIYVAGPNTVRDVADIAAKTSELNPRAVGIDGFYILGRDKRMGMWEKTLANVAEIRLDLCAQLNVPVVATTQLKGTKKKDDLQADADDAAYAKAIGDYADAMRGLMMDDSLDLLKQRVFTGMESREFKPVDILINFDLDRMNFDEIKVYEGPDKKADPSASIIPGAPTPLPTPPTAPPTPPAGGSPPTAPGGKLPVESF